MRVKVTSVEGVHQDGLGVEFTLEAMDMTDNPKCRVTINEEEFTLSEWKALSLAVEAAFRLVTEEA